jgi:hypothetical protein
MHCRRAFGSWLSGDVGRNAVNFLAAICIAAAISYWL